MVLASEASTRLDIPGSGLGWALAIGYVLASVLDIYLACALQVSGLSRRLPQRLFAGEAHEIEVTLENPHGRSLRLAYTEHAGHPGGLALALQGLPRSLKVPPRHRARFTYWLRPLQRGVLVLDECYLYLSGPLGLWDIRRRVTLPERTRVGPHLVALERFARQAVNERKRQRLGELAQCKGEAPGRVAPTQLLVWLDTGPAMLAGKPGARALDHAVDAALALALAAADLGLPVGLHLNAGPGPRQFIAAAGAHWLPALYRLLETVQATTQPVDVAVEAARLITPNAPPALIILMTRLSTANPFQAGPLAQLAREHRLIIADITDNLGHEIPRRPIRTDAAAQAYCRAIQAAATSEQAAEHLTRHGLEVLQAPGSALAEKVLERFVEVGRQADALSGRKLK
jgi:uncharacterized protein (DUF58 family)